MNKNEKKTLFNLGFGTSIVGNVLLGIENSNLKGENGRLHALNRGLSDQVEALAEEKRKLQDVVARRDADLAAMRKQNEELHERVTALDASIEALTQEKSALQDALEAKDEEVRTANHELANARADSADAHLRIKELEAEISRLREEKSTASSPAEEELST